MSEGPDYMLNLLLLITVISAFLFALFKQSSEYKRRLKRSERLVKQYDIEIELAHRYRKILTVSVDALETEVQHTLRELSEEIGQPLRITVETEGVMVLDAGTPNNNGDNLVSLIVLKNNGKIVTTVWGPEDLEDDLSDVLMTLHTLADAVHVNARNYMDASTDHLTGLYNRMAISSKVHDAVSTAKRVLQPVSLVMLDLDFFKEVNDRYGHLAGDMVIAQVGRILGSHTRETDIVGRISGDEFVIILPATDSNGAKRLAEQILKAIDHFEFVVEDQKESRKKLTLTASIGVSTLPDVASNGKELVGEADRVMYWGKQHGRNRVTVARTRTIQSTIVEIASWLREQEQDQIAG